jgi:Fe-S cluster biogenesis protein NfuA
VAAVARRCGLTRRQKQKAQIIAMYGGCCAYCGAREPALLQLDHVNDDGHIERRTHGFKYHLLLRQPRRSDLQLLCAACNDRKRFYGPDLGTWAAKQIAAEQGIITYRTPTTKDNIRNRRPRATVIALYGGYCVGCGSKEATILQIDHIQRIGRKARRLRKENGRQFFPRLLKQPVRSDLRLLCTNCNTRAKYYGQDICDWIEPMVSGA